jgi:hypothetical protein
VADGLIFHPGGAGSADRRSPLHLWQREAVRSILGGTVIYVVLVSTLFVG